MKLTVIAATGHTGREVVAQALAAGHDVTAVARNPTGFDDRVRTYRADLSATDPVTLEATLAGADAVVSGLGPRSRGDAGIARTGTLSILDAMQATQVTRLVVISAAPIGIVPSPLRPHPPKADPGNDWLSDRVLYPIIKRVFAGVYADLALMEDDVVSSSLDWTIVRPPQLTNGPLTGTYRTSLAANLVGGRKISRSDLAAAMLGALDDPGTSRQILRVAY